MVIPEYRLSSEEKKFLKYLESLIQETQHAFAHFELLRSLLINRSKYPVEFGYGLFLFSFTTDAHMYAALMEISKIFKEHKDAITIYKLLNYVEQNLNIFSEEAFLNRMKVKHKDANIEELSKFYNPIKRVEIEQDRRKLKELEDKIEHCLKWRDKVLTHIDKDFLLSGKDIAGEYSIKLPDLEQIIDTTFRILDKYSIAFNSVTNVKGYPRLNDGVQQVMEAIRFHIQEQNKQIEAQLETLKRQVSDKG